MIAGFAKDLGEPVCSPDPGPALTDKQKLAQQFVRHIKMQRSEQLEEAVKDQAKEPNLVR